MRVIFDTFQEFTADGRFEERAIEYRAVVYHNYFADTPLPYEVFGGLCDEQYGLLDSRYMLVTQGLNDPGLPD